MDPAAGGAPSSSIPFWLGGEGRVPEGSCDVCDFRLTQGRADGNVEDAWIKLFRGRKSPGPADPYQPAQMERYIHGFGFHTGSMEKASDLPRCIFAPGADGALCPDVWSPAADDFEVGKILERRKDASCIVRPAFQNLGELGELVPEQA
jgi:hypothetical protein